MSDSLPRPIDRPDFSQSGSLEDAFETNVPFSTEPPARSLGRAAWLLARTEAEFTLFATDPRLGLSAAQVTAVQLAFSEVLGDINEFLKVGLGADEIDEDELDSESHPLRRPLDEAIEGVDDEAMSAATDKSDTLVSLGLIELGMVSGSELIELLRLRLQTMTTTPAELSD